MQVAPAYNALQQVGNAQARLAMVSSDAFFDISTPAPTRDERFEAVAVIGQNLAHIATRSDGPADLSAVTSIATGPEGSSLASHCESVDFRSWGCQRH